MNRIKVINDPSDLVSLLHIVNTPIKKEVFQEISRDWRTIDEIEQKYGDAGKNAIQFLEKIKIVEVQWVNTPKGPLKSYRCYYNQFQISITMQASDIADTLYVATMPYTEVEQYENQILQLMKEKKSLFIGTVMENLNFSVNFIKAIIKRCEHLTLKGHNIERL